MKKRLFPLFALLVVAAVAGIYWVSTRPPGELMLTGLVTTDETIVGSPLQGRLDQLRVKEGDTVTNGELLAVIRRSEWKADSAFYTNSQQQSAAQAAQAEAELRYQETLFSNQVAEARATLAAAQAQVTQANANLEDAHLRFERETTLYHQHTDPVQAYDEARTAYAAAQAHADALRHQARAAQAALAVAQAGEEQVAVRRAGVQAAKHQLAAAAAQTGKARVRLDDTELRAPIAGIVDTRAALPGEILSPGQAILTLLNPDDLWVRIDVEETYIDRIRLGEKLPVRLPSGARLEGTVFYRSRDADYATQRDVSRSKRDIKTFEVRLRCDNRDRRLAVGMTAYVTVPLSHEL